MISIAGSGFAYVGSRGWLARETYLEGGGRVHADRAPFVNKLMDGGRRILLFRNFRMLVARSVGLVTFFLVLLSRFCF